MFDNEREEKGSAGATAGMVLTVLAVGVLALLYVTGNLHISGVPVAAPTAPDVGPLTELPVERIVPPAEKHWVMFDAAFLAAAETKEARTISGHFAFKPMLGMAYEGLEFEPGYLTNVVREARKASLEPTGVAGSLAGMLAAGGSLMHLGYEERDGHRWTVFRAVRPHGGFDHIALLPVNGSTGVRAWDSWTMSTGLKASEIARKMVLGVSVQGAQGKLKGAEALQVEHAEEMNAVATLALGGSVAAAGEAFAKLPKELRDVREMQLLAAQLSMVDGVEAYRNACAAYLEDHGDDATAAWGRYQVFVSLQEWGDAAEALQALKKLAVPDPYLDVLLAGVRRQQGDVGEAKRLLEAALVAEPALEELPTVAALAAQLG